MLALSVCLSVDQYGCKQYNNYNSHDVIMTVALRGGHDVSSLRTRGFARTGLGKNGAWQAPRQRIQVSCTRRSTGLSKPRGLAGLGKPAPAKTQFSVPRTDGGTGLAETC